METQTASSLMYPFIVLYDMHTAFFPKVLDGITDADAHSRLNTKANHVAWLAGSLVHERYEMANALGIDVRQAADELFEDHKGIQDSVTYPPLADFIADWNNITPVLRNAYLDLSDEKLESPFTMPGETMTFFDLISFITYREANCIGQIALWRRLLGYEPMRYM